MSSPALPPGVDPPTTWDLLQDMLLDPRTYPDRTEQVELRETHISWVLLTDRYVYKLKKPVRFGFLDFSTAPLRRKACEDEVRLNQRFAPQTYLGVVCLSTTDDGRHANWQGHGKPLDWLVKMRRLPADRTLDHLLSQGQLSHSQATQLSEFLSGFYCQQPPIVLTPDCYSGRLLQHVVSNHTDLHRLLPSADHLLWQRIHAAQLLFLKLCRRWIHERVLNGRIVEGHGDLRPEHIYLLNHPVVLDCVEFNQELRTVDCLDDLCFLSMECCRLQHPELAHTILSTYRTRAGDNYPERLASFYQCYRASVRAKVTALRLVQHDDAIQHQQLVDYLLTANQSARGIHTPFVIAVGGLMGTGKTTLARSLADEFALDCHSSDDIRRELWGASETPAGYGEGNYQPDRRRAVYDQLRDRMTAALAMEHSVVLDASFHRGEDRERMAREAKAKGAEFLFLACHCPLEVARQRITERLAEGTSTSEGREELLVRQRAEAEPWPRDQSILEIDTHETAVAPQQKVFGRLRELLGLL